MTSGFEGEYSTQWQSTPVWGIFGAREKYNCNLSVEGDALSWKVNKVSQSIFQRLASWFVSFFKETEYLSNKSFKEGSSRSEFRGFISNHVQGLEDQRTLFHKLNQIQPLASARSSLRPLSMISESFSTCSTLYAGSNRSSNSFNFEALYEMGNTENYIEQAKANPQEAITILKNMCESRPTYFQPHYLLGRIYAEALNQHGMAIEFYTIAYVLAAELGQMACSPQEMETLKQQFRHSIENLQEETNKATICASLKDVWTKVRAENLCLDYFFLKEMILKLTPDEKIEDLLQELSTNCREKAKLPKYERLLYYKTRAHKNDTTGENLLLILADSNDELAMRVSGEMYLPPLNRSEKAWTGANISKALENFERGALEGDIESIEWIIKIAETAESPKTDEEEEHLFLGWYDQATNVMERLLEHKENPHHFLFLEYFEAFELLKEKFITL